LQGGALPWLVGVCLVVASATQATAQTLPSPWATQDVGSPAVAGTASASSGTFSLTGAGVDIWDTSDQFRFVYQQVQGDIEIVARVASLQGPDEWSKAGVMIRAALTGPSQNAFVGATRSRGWTIQHRLSSGATTLTNDPKLAGAAPGWVRLVRKGNLFTGYHSTDGTSWTLLGSNTITMGSTVYVGLAVTSHNASQTSTATFTNVNAGAGAGTALPSPWKNADVGAPAVAGTATASSGTFSLTGAGSDIWDASDQFQFVYQPVQGDIEIVARVASLQGPHSFSKAGVMIRAALTGPSQNAFVGATQSSGWTIQHRLSSGAVTLTNDPKPSGAAPGWVRLVREGNLFTGYYSTDGSAWTLLGSDTITMGSTVYVGLAVTSHDESTIATGSFSNVAVRTPDGRNQAPTVSVTSPSAGASFTAPANIAIAAAAADTDGTVSRVDFYRGSTLIGSDTSSPFSTTWTSAPAGTYSLTARATDNGGATTTSAPVSITVGSTSNQLPIVSITSPASGATFSTGANVTIAATASDPDGSVSRVDFYRGSTLIASDTTNPYSATWSNATAGTHSLTAVARDNAGATRTSAAVSITVGSSGSSGPVPAPWSNRDVGSPSLNGSATHASGVFTVRGAGTDIGGTADQFHMVHQAASGDIEIVARVDSLQGTSSAKGGVMIREALSSGARNVYLAAAGSSGWTLQARTWGGGSTSSVANRSGTAPGWVRLVRAGKVFTGYTSTNGSSWTAIGSVTLGMSSKVRVGLAVTSRSTGTLATGTFSNVLVRTPSGNQAPSVSLTAPAAGATFTAPANIALTASASDSDGSIAKVDFYRGSTLIGSDSTSPYSVTWTGAPAGSYTLTAVATDDDGATRTSAGVNITVNSTSNQLPTVSITSPTSGSNYIAPATMSITASASDPDGTVTRVDFYSGSQLVGTDTTSPFTASWSNVAAGTYSLTAIARDDRGASRTSASVTITVSAATLPTRLSFTPSADHATGVTSYSVAIRRAGDAVTATPVATRDLGKPAVLNNEITVDISTLVNPLPSGSYYAVVTAIGPGGSTASAPSPSFTK
jgi:regulation of enolase protein 1 (concanavalin A-like superfamily)